MPISMVSTASMLTAVRLGSFNSKGSVPPSRSPPPLSLPKPTWIVRTQSNVRRSKVKKPDPPCVVCQGIGRVDCPYCYGKGRTNQAHLEMLPRGEWPKWCRTCGGSGLTHCSRCLGTGEYRYIMGFRFMNRDADHSLDIKYPIPGNHSLQSAAERLLHREQNDIGNEI